VRLAHAQGHNRDRTCLGGSAIANANMKLGLDASSPRTKALTTTNLSWRFGHG